MTTPLRSSPVLIIGWCSGGAWRGRGRGATPRGSIGCAPGCYQSRPPRPRQNAAGGAGSAGGVERDDVAREPGQALDASLGGVEVDEVLDPDAGLAFYVDYGVHREHG